MHNIKHLWRAQAKRPRITRLNLFEKPYGCLFLSGGGGRKRQR